MIVHIEHDEIIFFETFCKEQNVKFEVSTTVPEINTTVYWVEDYFNQFQFGKEFGKFIQLLKGSRL